MSFFTTIILGVLPSFVWLLFFLRKDAHPEPKTMILKVFFVGALAAPVAAMVGTGFQEALLDLNLSPSSMLFSFIYILLGVGLVEEALKYLVVRFFVLSHHEFDEPVDAMLYMIISGLGFAALENILIVLSQAILNQSLGDTLYLIIYRFLTATFLHALSSAFIGYFLALSICDTKHQFKLISLGLGLGAILHGLYDLAVIHIDRSLVELRGQLTILDYKIFMISSFSFFIILFGLAIFALKGFRELKKMKSVCKI